MPSRKVMFRCPLCKCKNHIRAKFCNNCGNKIECKRNYNEAERKFYIDTAHPIKADCRQMIVQAVMDAYDQECAKIDNFTENNSVSENYDEIECNSFSGQIDLADYDSEGVLDQK